MPLEAAATACNLVANALLLRRAMHDPRGAVPMAVVALQLVGNVLWVSHAAWVAHDPYLGTTALMGGGMQLATCVALWKAHRRARLALSDTQLPCLPPAR